MQHLKQDLVAIAHLPLLERLAHTASRKPLKAIGLSVVIMMSGSLIAQLAHHFGDLVFHTTLDTTGYLIHAVGAVPIIRYAEPIWILFMGLVEEEVL